MPFGNAEKEDRPKYILPVIVASQFAGTSLWFSVNAVLGDLQGQWPIASGALGYLTSAVQLGFICGTLLFALLILSDRYSPRRVFLICSLLGALANVSIFAAPGNLAALLAIRFVTGIFLAGIYPVGMKIASGWYREGLGRALGFLVGALVLGTAFPHLLRAFGAAWPWQGVVGAVSVIAALGGMLMFACVPDGPYLARSARFDPAALAVIFRSSAFRAAAFGYFGHMWELYAFWAFVPVALAAALTHVNVALGSFVVMAAGAAGCIIGGYASLRIGSARVAAYQLAASGACCAVSPLLFAAPTPLVLAFLIFWGAVVVGDSPQFSALTAVNAPREWVGSALTISTCCGFALTIVSIQLLNALAGRVPVQYLFLLLVPGPVVGLAAMRPLLKSG